MSISALLYKLFDVTGSNRLAITQWMLSVMSGYNHKKYWLRREVVVNPLAKVNPLVKMYYLFYIKRVDYKHCCSFGTSYNSGSQFDTPPIFRMDLMG